jgi:CheY-like chemotaxis protein
MCAHVLIAEDNPPSRELLTYLLRSRGHTTQAAATGTHAVRLADAARLDLVLVDLQLPDLDGYQLLRQLRSGRRHAATPIVAVTALAMIGERERAIHAGFDDYMAKPINPRTFPDDVQGWLGGTGGRSTPAGSAAHRAR